jgi:hypothetical protein
MIDPDWREIYDRANQLDIWFLEEPPEKVIDRAMKNKQGMPA